MEEESKIGRTGWAALRVSLSDLQGHRLSGDRIEDWYNRERLDYLWSVTKKSRDSRKFRAGQTEDSFNSIQQQGFFN